MSAIEALERALLWLGIAASMFLLALHAPFRDARPVLIELHPAPIEDLRGRYA